MRKDRIGEASRRRRQPAPRVRVLVTHPSPDVYGSDLQLLESIIGLTESNASVRVLLPKTGPLTNKLTKVGAEVYEQPFPVLRKSIMSPRGLSSFIAQLLLNFATMWRATAEFRPDVVLVNTVTIPHWIVIGKLLRIPVVCHVHEAEDDRSRSIQRLLNAPLVLATTIVTNSDASTRALLATNRRLAGRIKRIYNGISIPSRGASPFPTLSDGTGAHLQFVGRLSPRKGPDILLRAAALMKQNGTDLRVSIVGSVFEGYEWYETELRRICSESGLLDDVDFHGYLDEPFSIACPQTILVVPSRREPFGNVAAEGQLAGLPVVASSVQGLTEIVIDELTGLLFEPGNAEDLATKLVRMIDDTHLRSTLVETAQKRSLTEFTVSRYRKEITEIVRAQGTRKPNIDAERKI